MDEKDKIIEYLERKLNEKTSECNALEQEVALLNYELEKVGADVSTDFED